MGRLRRTGRLGAGLPQAGRDRLVDRFNRSRIAPVIVSTNTSNLRLAAAPGNVELDEGASGLDRASVVDVSQTLVVDRTRLVEVIGTLDLSVMRRVDDGLRLVLGL